MFLNMKKICIVSLLVLLFQGIVFANTQNQNEQSKELKILKSLHWIYGPKVVRVGKIATFKIPSGYMFLYPQDTAKIMEIFHNPPSYKDEYYFGPKNFEWYGIFSYDDIGHVPDNENINADDLIESIKRGTEKDNKIRIQKGWKPMYILGWKFKPFYDKETKRLSWAIDAESGGSEVINYNTRILGRTGVTSAILVAGTTNLNHIVDTFNKVVDGYKFNDDQRYSSFTEGDKVAKYGLAALIAGGAAAVATKKGFWATLIIGIKVFWKFIIAGIIAFFAFIGNIFKRKD